MLGCNAGNSRGRPQHLAHKSQVRQRAGSAQWAEACSRSTWVLSNKRQGPGKYAVQKESSGRRNEQIHGDKGGEP